jgi:hypothetical protein
MDEEQDQTPDEQQEQDQYQGKKGGSRSPWLAVIIVVLLIAIAFVLYLLWSTSQEEPTAPQTESPPPAAETEDPYTTTEVAIGEPGGADPYIITVTGAGRTVIEIAETPPEGTSYYVVGVTFQNTGETVPINGQPYSVDGTILESSSGVHEGIMQVDFGNPMSEGTIPGGSTFNMNFVFTVPDEASDFTFVWTPATPDYPRIVVPLEE